MKVIGLTGSTGSGKSYAAELLAKAGIPSVDCDAVCHLVYKSGEECNAELCSFFGDGIKAENGDIDRVKLRETAFSTPENYAALNEIAHRHIKKKVLSLVEGYRNEGKAAVLIDAPLLFESGFDSFCDLVVSVIADRETQIRRVCKRDGITPDVAVQRLEKQKSNYFYVSGADAVIDNSDANADNVKGEIIALGEKLINENFNPRRKK